MINVKNGLLYQWDLNRSIEVFDLKREISEIHCCHEGDEEALLIPFSQKEDKLEAIIPNIFLQSGKAIHIYLVNNDDNEVKTIEHKLIPVFSRQKPSGYIYEESEILNYTHLENEIKEVLSNKADLDENGKLSAEQIPSDVLKDEALTQAVNTALFQAKESGEFKGDKGADGYTPVKGTDYFTESDKAEIVASVVESLGGSPVFGYVDENNNIVVQGNLANGNYSVKYEMEDGSTVDIGSLVLDSDIYINQIPISTDVNGNLFVGDNGEKGYKTGYRMSMSSGNETAQSGYAVTGFIPVKYNDVVRIKNIDVTSENNTNIIFYNSSKAKLISSGNSGTTLYSCFVTNGTESNGVYTSIVDDHWLNNLNGVAYIRIGSKSITDDSIITVNEEIV